MSENTFTLEQITEMAKKVRLWKDSTSNEPNSLTYFGMMSPKWYSLDKLVIKVGRALAEVTEPTTLPRYTYSATVTYSDKKIADYQGEGASGPFAVAYRNKKIKQDKIQTALQELRETLTGTPQESSVVPPLTYDEVAGMINKMSKCKVFRMGMTLHQGGIDKYHGKFNTNQPNSSVKIIGYAKKYDYIGGSLLFVRGFFKGEKVFEIEGEPAQELIKLMDNRIGGIVSERYNKGVEARLEGIKKAIVRKTVGEKK